MPTIQDLNENSQSNSIEPQQEERGQLFSLSSHHQDDDAPPTSVPSSPFSRTAAVLSSINQENGTNGYTLYNNQQYPPQQHYFNNQSPAIPSHIYNEHRRTSTMSSATESAFNMSVSQSIQGDIPALITPKEIQSTLKSYSGVLDAAAKYREALASVSHAAAEFGAALEECSKCKGAGSSADGLLAAGGLHYLVSNHQQILANSIEQSFEVPVKKQLDILSTTANQNEKGFKEQVRLKTRQLRDQEKLNQKLAKRRGIGGNLVDYRKSLQDLTAKIDEISNLKHEYFESAYNLAENTSKKLLVHTSSVVRAEVEIYEGIARKGWSGGGLDDLISACPDPFSKDDEEREIEDISQPLHQSSPNQTSPSGLFGINTFKPHNHASTEIYTVLPTNRSILPQFAQSNGDYDDESNNSRDDSYSIATERPSMHEEFPPISDSPRSSHTEIA